MTELLCIQTHSQGAVVAGQVYPLIKQGKPCGCDCVDVGISSRLSPDWYPHPNARCSLCDKVFPDDEIWWFGSVLFAQVATEEERSESKQKLELIETP